MRLEIETDWADGHTSLEGAANLLKALSQVEAVDSRTTDHGTCEFDVRCDEDLRAAVGVLAHEQGWTVRELSWRKATLEELFARIALNMDAPTPEVAQ